MDSTQIVNLYLTGFGEFNGCKSNPTTEIVNQIDFSSLEQLEGYQFNVEFREIVGVDIESVNNAISSIKDALKPHLNDGSKNLVLHLGVNQGTARICLEKQAANIMDFGCPDMKGNCPENEQIDKDKELKYKLKCKLDLSSLCEKLTNCSHKCKISSSAGQYICNYIYYCSLKEHNEIENVDIIFVHVPSFKTMKKEDQMSGIIDLIKNWILE